MYLRTCSFGLLALLVVVCFGSCTKVEKPAADARVASAASTAMPSDAQLKQRLDDVIIYTKTQRHLDTKVQAAWQIVHGALVFGRDFQVYDNNGELVSALDYLLGGGELKGWTMRPGDHGVLAVIEAGTKTGQGHPDQWLGYLSQCGLQPDEPLKVGGRDYHISDLITQAQWDIYEGMEATWTLMAFCTYLPLDAKWKAKDGSTWTIERIVAMEAKQDLGLSACGGSHRLYGLSVALNRHLKEGGKLTGAWKEADKVIQDSISKAREYQQPDGGFSTNFFSRAASSPDLALRINTTGHTLEFLTLALGDEEISKPWVKRAVNYLVDVLDRTKKADLECGSLYHAVHGLALYRLRQFGPPSETDMKAARTAADQQNGAAKNPAQTTAAKPADRN